MPHKLEVVNGSNEFFRRYYPVSGEEYKITLESQGYCRKLSIYLMQGHHFLVGPEPVSDI